MSKILANHPRLSKFVFGLFGAAGMIWLNKAFQGDELFQLITSLLALDTFVNFCIYSLINPIPEANDFLWDYKVHQRKYSSNISHNDFVSNFLLNPCQSVNVFHNRLFTVCGAWADN